MPVDRERIRDQLGQGLGSHEIAHGDRETFFAVLEEEARLAGELGAFEATPENVVMLRDERTLRWEAIAARVFGGVRRVGEVKALYDELKGQGAARRSYTGRGRRFPGMGGGDSELVEPSAVSTRESRHFGIARESSASSERLGDLDLLRVGSLSQVPEYLERHLHSDRFYVDSSRIWLELPNRVDAPPDKAILTWFRIPSGYIVAAPQAGTRAGHHAVPTGWDASLCTLPLSSWSSGVRVYRDGDVTCRWCALRLTAIEIASGNPAQLTTDDTDASGIVEPPVSSLRECRGREAQQKTRLRQVLAEGTGAEARISVYGAHVVVGGGQGIGAVYLLADDDSEIELALHPADTLTQARNLYGNPSAVSGLRELCSQPSWRARPNFHFGHFERGYCWTCNETDINDYLDIWVNRISTEGAVARADWESYWQWLEQERIACPEDWPEFEKHFVNTSRQSASPRPGVSLSRRWPLGEAEDLDEQGQFAVEVGDALDKALTMLSEPPFGVATR